MPVQVVPHMYRMLRNEVAWALEDVSSALYSQILDLFYVGATE